MKRKRKGATVVLVALLLPIVMLLSAFAINLAYMDLNRTEILIAVDAATRAAGRDFALNGNQATARAIGRNAVARNLVSGQELQLADSDFVFGESTRQGVSFRYTFDSNGANPNAVRVTGRRSAGSLSGPIPLLMPSMLGISDFNVTSVSQSTQIEVDVALVIDRSGSMAYADDEPAVYPPLPAAAGPGWAFGDAAPDPSRWRDAVEAVDVFLNELQSSPANELVAMCSYSTNSSIDHQLSSDYPSVLSSLDTYTQSFNLGWTDIGAGINEATNAFSNGQARPWASKVIIVLTDGKHSDPTGATDPVAAAEDAADQGIMVFTVTFSDEAEQANMQEVAEVGFGQHFHAQSASDLITVFQEIGKVLPTLLTR